MNKILDPLDNVFNDLPSFIFLGGVHGVGKTTLCNSRFVSEGYHCVTASSLTKAYKNGTDRDKRVDDIDDNQIALLKQLNLEKEKHQRLLLDGHFCLINSFDQIEPIDVEVFKAINPALLILLKCNPVEIAERLTKRDGKPWRVKFMREFQELEESHAQVVSKKMNIPLKIFTNYIQREVST